MGVEAFLGGGLCRTREALTHRGWRSASSAVKNSPRIKLFFSTVKRKRKGSLQQLSAVYTNGLYVKSPTRSDGIKKIQKMGLFSLLKGEGNLPSGQS